MTDRALRLWSSLATPEKARWHGVTICAVLYLVHYVLFSTWYIEDAAITFTFARHAASGEGFVAWPGGERVEGFSNPSWTLLLTALDLFGLNPWIGAKLAGALFGLLTLPLAYAWAKDLLATRGERPGAGEGDHGLLPVVAPLLLATSPQFVLWNASGLENSAVNLCLAAAAVWLLRDRLTGALRGAVPLGLLAISRPDAPLFCAAVAGLAVVFAARDRARATGAAGVASAAGWAVAVAALSLSPLIAWKAWAYWYFAWPFPNTYYAKSHAMDRFAPFGWGSFPWEYVRTWALVSAWGFLLPLAAPVLTGLRGRRGTIGAVVAVAWVVLLAPGLDWPQVAYDWTEPELLVKARVVALAGGALLLPLVGLGRRGDAERTVAWAVVIASLFFALYAGGDWMKAHRWMATAQVPLAVLLVDAVAELLPLAVFLPRVAPDRKARVLVGALVGPVVVAGVVTTGRFLDNVETSPYDVYQRVRYMKKLQERLHLDHVVNMDVDFGAQMWWTGHELLDMAGLNDVPVAHHAWDLPFVKEYILLDRRPDFAHVHGSWKDKAQMGKQPVFRRDWVEVPGYASNRNFFHIGNHVRKDLFVQPSWTGGDERQAGFGAVQLAGLDVPATRVPAGQTLYVELGWTMGRGKARPFRPVLFLHREGRFVAWEAPPGYDWIPVAKWRRGEVFVGRHDLPLPADLPEGSYDLGVVVLGDDGEVWPAEATAATDPVYARGEVRWVGAVEIVAEPEAERLLAEAQRRALDEAAAVRCSEAERVINVGRHHLAPDHPKQPRDQGQVIAAMAACWARAAEATSDDPTAEDAIRRARRWDHREPEVERVSRLLADRWEAAGDQAMAAEEPVLDDVWHAWRRALVAEPHRSWLARRAEEVRDQRLGITKEAE